MELLVVTIIAISLSALVLFWVQRRRTEAEDEYISLVNDAMQRILKYTQQFPRFDELSKSEIVEATFATQIVAGEARGWKVPRAYRDLHRSVLAFLDSVAVQWKGVPDLSDEEANNRIARMKEAAETMRRSMRQALHGTP